MKATDTVRDIMTTLGYTQQRLSEATGYSAAAGIAQVLARKDMKIEMLTKLVNAMGCEVVIRNDDYEWVLGKELSELKEV